MKKEVLDINKLIKYWVNGSDNDYEAMHDLYNTKHYHWSLFIGHIVIKN